MLNIIRKNEKVKRMLIHYLIQPNYEDMLRNKQKRCLEFHVSPMQNGKKKKIRNIKL